ncbi:hypothetical protein BBK14_06775 [Parafrankia soli]|uniref:Uncharacterized protein n=1 Tax=Parafrankia soli TaxID=2599596 RepID=A0A1S1PM73_9ACTN|nr:hypothetical protein BBK14_06775 [Parafrankia soli]
MRITAGHGWCASRRQSLAYPPPVRVTRTDIEFPHTLAAAGCAGRGERPPPAPAPASVAGAAGGKGCPARVGRAGL